MMNDKTPESADERFQPLNLRQVLEHLYGLMHQTSGADAQTETSGEHCDRQCQGSDSSRE